MRHLEKGRVVVFAGGTGNPYFSTDTAAALRAAEMHAEIILMAKQGVDGVYSADPKTDPGAIRYDTLSFDQAIRENLRVMDQTAIALCRENQLPIIVFDMSTPGNICQVAAGNAVGTRVGA
jgi:uridylate kinase